MEYCSALKRKEILTYATTWMNYGDVNCELPDVQAGFRKARGTRSNCQHLLNHQKSKRIPEKHLLQLY